VKGRISPLRKKCAAAEYNNNKVLRPDLSQGYSVCGDKQKKYG
jgi:hypothetical protein